MEENEQKEEGVGSFAFFRSFYETIESMPDEEALKFVKMICKYCFLEVAPDETTDWAQMALFQSTKKTLDISMAKSRAGKNGGTKSKRVSEKKDAKTEEVEWKSEPQEEEVKEPKKPKKDAVPKNRYAEFVTMTEEEYTKLVQAHGEQATQGFIARLDNYKGSSGSTYKSDYRAILSWVVDSEKKVNPKPLYQQNLNQPIDPNINPYG